MTVAAATPADVRALTDLLNVAYAAAEAYFHTGPRTSIAEVVERVAMGTFLVSRSDDGIDGCVWVQAKGALGYLGMLAVSPRRQGIGLGPALVHAGEAHLRERGVERLEIDVISLRRPLFGFYERLGYRVTGQRPFEDPRLLVPCHLVVMEKSLRAQDPASRPLA